MPKQIRSRNIGEGSGAVTGAKVITYVGQLKVGMTDPLTIFIADQDYELFSAFLATAANVANTSYTVTIAGLVQSNSLLGSTGANTSRTFTVGAGGLHNSTPVLKNERVALDFGVPTAGSAMFCVTLVLVPVKPRMLRKVAFASQA